MKASVYINYTSRSLFRSGQRTVLALFCIAVGVMSIVALQLVGQMINNSYTSNIRVANGGDIAISSYNSGLSDNDLTYFDTLKAQGKISNCTATASYYGALGSTFSTRNEFTIQVVDPHTFPLVGDLAFNAPAAGQLANLLQNHQVVMDQQLADQYNKKVGDTLNISVMAYGQIAAPVKLAGIVADSGLLQSRRSLMFMSIQDFKVLVHPRSWLYSNVYVTTPVADDAHIKAAASLISDKFPLMSVTTTTDALKQRQDSIDMIKKFLEVSGLLALLIGGVGIVNTMQVLLSRRKVEIAMLKTAGYRRLDLYLLFGLEAGLLGLIGGVIGALAACGMSFIVLQVMQNAMGITIPFQLDPWIIGGGVLIGLCTALIFGLMPIVQAANIRPLNVLRDTQSGNVLSNVGLSIALVLLLSVLFCVMAGVILNSAMLAIYAVYGAFAALLILALIFLLIVFLIGHLPVPEHFSFKYIVLVGLPLLLSLALTLLLPTFGLILTFIALMGIVVVFLPRGWKSNIKMALRNIGRSRGRTVTTMLALYVGVFTIGLILLRYRLYRGVPCDQPMPVPIMWS
jgi:Predicted ABC-type transport system involved in lysophospholipase L1 biosynthesis, permease component